MKSKIILENIKIYAYHGVLPEEKIIGTYFLVDVEVTADVWKSSVSDEVDDTISYADLNEIVHEEMQIPSKLIEHVAGRILEKIHLKFPQITFAKIKVSKTNPPMKGELKAASVVLEKDFLPKI